MKRIGRTSFYQFWLYALLIISRSQLSQTVSASDLSTFTAEGTLVTEIFQNAKLPIPTARSEESVTFCFSNGWWRIELKYKSGFDPYIPPSSLEGKIDTCETLKEGVRVLTGFAVLPKPDAWQSADVFATPFPPPELVNLLTCWLTLCPNPVLPIISESRMRRFVSSEFLRDQANEGQYRLSYLPGNVFISQLDITNNGLISTSLNKTGRLNPPFDKGHLELEYKVLETTNWGGIEFPCKSILRKFVPMSEGSDANSLLVCLESQLKIDSFQADIVKAQIDSNKLKLLAYDNRMAKLPEQQPVTYIVTNGNWPDPTGKALLQLAHAQYDLALPKPLKQGSGRKKTTLVLIALILGPVVGLMLYIRDKKQKGIS
jgi:hypothetical protein